MRLVSALYFAASEYVNVISAGLRRLHYAVDAYLAALRLGLDERHLGERNGTERCAVVGRGVAFVHLEGVRRHHDRVARYAVNADGVVGWELRIVFHVVQSAVQILAYAGVRAEHIALAVQLHGYAVGVLVVAEATVQRHHEVVLGVHAGALYEPGDVWRVERGRHVVAYFAVGRAGTDGLLQRLELRLEGAVAVPAGVFQNTLYGRCAKIRRVGVAETGYHAVGEEVLRRREYGLPEHGQLLE